MTTALLEKRIHCPWCGEGQYVLVDLSAGGQCYVEDCQVCCRPMQIAFESGDGELTDLQVSCEG